MKPNCLKLLIVDDDRLWGERLKATLEKTNRYECEYIDSFKSFELKMRNCFKHNPKSPPAVIVMDYQFKPENANAADLWDTMCETGAEDFVPWIRNIPMIPLTSQSDPRVQVWAAQFTHYSLKVPTPESMAKVLDNVILQKVCGAKDTVVYADDLSLYVEQKKIYYKGRPISLGTPHFFILSSLIQHVNRPCPKQSLYEEAVGGVYDDTKRTIDAYVAQTRAALRKAGMKSPETIITCQFEAYKLEAQVHGTKTVV